MSKILRSYSTSISGVLSIDRENGMTILVEDCEDPISLANFFADFNNSNVTVEVSWKANI